MAKIDRFMIAPINTGLQTDIRPWLIPDDAFSSLDNAYVFRGRVRKRFGSTLMNDGIDAATRQLYSRLRINVGTTAAVTGNLGATIMPGATWAIGQMFSVGDTMFTVAQAIGATLTTGTATAFYDTATGTLVITGNNENPLTDVYFYPSTPVMGLLTYDSSIINDETTIAFDTQFAYQYNGTAWARAGAAVWTGLDFNFFWGCNWRGVDSNDYILYVTNFNPPDFIKYWNGATWTNLTPTLNAGATTLKSCRIIVTFKGRLIVLNTFEGVGGAATQFGNRARWSQNGTPLVSSDVNAWREDITGKGGFVDAATKEQIVSCAFIKDRLIVYFERSTWELVFAQNQVLPFYWQRINSELGAESTFSAVPFDKVALGMGNVGIHACNGANVDRIDQKIPQQVFEISNEDQGVERVYGIRDYFTQMVYWAFPDNYRSTIYPNKILVFNYITGSWSIFEDSITCFGYFQQQDDLTWATWITPWEECVAPWNSGSSDARFRSVIAGNQEGFVFIINPDVTSNANVLQINDMLAFPPSGIITIECINHNLQVGDYIQISSAQGVTGINNKIYFVESIDEVNGILTILEPSFAGVYRGGGTIARVSNIYIKTKQYNFYVDDGRNAYISKVDFHVDSTEHGQVTIDYFIGSSDYSIVDGGEATGALLGTSVLETSPYALSTFEEEQDQLWHPIYLQADGQSIQLQIYMTDEQMTNPLIAFSDFELHAMTFYATPTASRLQ